MLPLRNGQHLTLVCYTLNNPVVIGKNPYRVPEDIFGESSCKEMRSHHPQVTVLDTFEKLGSFDFPKIFQQVTMVQLFLSGITNTRLIKRVGLSILPKLESRKTRLLPFFNISKIVCLVARNIEECHKVGFFLQFCPFSEFCRAKKNISRRNHNQSSNQTVKKTF